jgi:hypothetical protein
VNIPSPCCRDTYVGVTSRGIYGCMGCGAVVERTEMAERIRMARRCVRAISLRLAKPAAKPAVRSKSLAQRMRELIGLGMVAVFLASGLSGCAHAPPVNQVAYDYGAGKRP